MSAPSHDCDRYREEHLLGATGASSTAAGCGDCRAWAERSRQLTGLLSTLERHPAPAELNAMLVETVDLGAVGQEPLLRGLERLEAPVELEEALVRDLTEGLAMPLALLERHRAPAVLDRLVDEELRDPAAVTRRFSRSLFRFDGPRSLADRIDRELRESPRRRSTLRLSLGGLAAAALLAVGLIPLLGSRPEQPPLSFEVVEVGDLDQLDHFARSLVEGLAGGMVNPVRPNTDRGTGPLTDGGGR